MAVRPDNRLLDTPMQEVTCRRCAARVEVRKGSWHQTSVQWNADALTACEERRAATAGPGPNGDFFEACASLRASIAEAATSGLIPVLDDGY
ncbi:ferredoxin [Geodermatophilus marinus]|uniref:ferredoxin n=1 Tax=Geodermatophilus sp. LHW52908 TaxID=2303986 RepID=UPI000E3D7381|nr:ferredoxin [Geodermatophilus sp. LHW52908]RFU20533.1 ferredoxin [Geodermatophilus sp. LHW52908]